MTAQLWKNLAPVLAGALSIMALFMLTGAGSHPTTGRFEMEAVVRDRSIQIYVIDTATGVVKWVDEMNTPFEQMKGE